MLVQQHLVWWLPLEVEGQTVYEANLAAAYALTRLGKYQHVVEDRFGNLERNIFYDMLQLGDSRIGDLVQRFTIAEASHRGDVESTVGSASHDLPNNMSNRLSDVTEGNTPDSVYQSLHNLLKAGLLILVNDSHFRSPADNRSEARKKCPAVLNKASAKTKENLLALDVDRRLLEWQHMSQKYREDIANFGKGKKRPLEEPESETEHSNKKRKLDKSRSEDVTSISTDKEPEVFVDGHLNVQKLLVET